MKPRVVMKFGGTSVGTPEAVTRAAALVAAQQQRRPLVVVSAVGGVTNLLIEAASVARAGRTPDDCLAEIDRRHRVVAERVGLDLESSGLLGLQRDLARLLQGISLLRELTPRIQDEVVSFGERVSVRLLAAALRRTGLDAQPFNAWELGLRTDNCHGRAEPLPPSTAAIVSAIEALAAQVVPVVTGFIGRSEQGEITTLGRGGSDLSAAIFAAATGVDELQIWTDVNGIMRADPRVVPRAEVVPSIRFEEAAELAYFGAKVLHPRTIEPARQRRIPVRVLGTFDVEPESLPAPTTGTLIDENAPLEPVRALALRQGVESLHIHSLRMLDAPGFLARVFEILARHGISVDVIATSEVSISMTFNRHEGDLAGAVAEISSFAQVEAFPERSILCLVGSGLREDASLLSLVFGTLAENDVPVHVISQGASRINITVVTDPPCAERAMVALYERLFARL